MVTSLLLLFLVLMLSQSASAASLNLSLSAQDTALVDEDIPVTLNLNLSNSSLTYDIKLYINDDNSAASEIFSSGSWISPYHYLISVFPAASVFHVRAKQTGNSNLCVRLRETGKTSFTQVCNPIKVSANPPDASAPANSNSVQNNSGSTQKVNNTQPAQPVQSDLPATTQPVTASPATSIPSGPITATYDKPSASQDASFISPSESTKIWIFGGFAAFCLLIIIFLALRKL